MPQFKSNSMVVPEAGDDCPRCGVPMRVYTHRSITPRQRAKPFYYAKWFMCCQSACQTKFTMPKRYRVWNVSGAERERIERWLDRKDAEGREREVETVE
jgi:hypothetical protein